MRKNAENIFKTDTINNFRCRLKHNLLYVNYVIVAC